MLPSYLHVNMFLKKLSWHTRSPETNIICQLDCLEVKFQYVDCGFDNNIILKLL